ncbi:hypothetical protein E2C01_060882 [Portunus trituberculatus]|uniref:Uncharacterized protein n=1 Tax=Portunus trituberculatus TaxID=210409 RepID=A0A5B7H3S6_PORTR|nr:hypothetical protein [Portunus trituberculatus]
MSELPLMNRTFHRFVRCLCLSGWLAGSLAVCVGAVKYVCSTRAVSLMDSEWRRKFGGKERGVWRSALESGCACSCRLMFA